MGKDVHEVRKYRDEADRNPSSPGGDQGGPRGLRAAPKWVQKLAEAQARRRATRRVSWTPR